MTPSVLASSRLRSIEHVRVTISLTHPCRGDIEIELVSPAGVTSRLVSARPRDSSEDGFVAYKLMSVAHWYGHAC